MTGLEIFRGISHNKTMRFQLLKNLFIFFPLISVLAASDGFCQKIKVKKTRGLSAVIESSVPLEEGKVYDLAVESISQNVDYRASGFKSRQNSFSLGGSVSALRGDDYQKNSISLQGRYGWNFANLEFGGIAQFSSDDIGAGATNDFTGGGYFDYNFIANRDPKSMIYGAVGIVTFGSKQFPSASGGGSATTLALNLGGFLTWFINSSSTTALRLEGYAELQQISTTAKQTNVTGGGSRALMIFYF